MSGTKPLLPLYASWHAHIDIIFSNFCIMQQTITAVLQNFSLVFGMMAWTNIKHCFQINNHKHGDGGKLIWQFQQGQASSSGSGKERVVVVVVVVAVVAAAAAAAVVVVVVIRLLCSAMKEIWLKDPTLWPSTYDTKLNSTLPWDDKLTLPNATLITFYGTSLCIQQLCTLLIHVTQIFYNTQLILTCGGGRRKQGSKNYEFSLELLVSAYMRTEGSNFQHLF